MKALLLALLFSTSAQAGQILFNLRGEQFLETVGPGGGVTSDAQVVWDTSKDGPLPAGAPVGSAERYEVEVEEIRKVCAKKPQDPVRLRSLAGAQCELVDEVVKVMQPRLRESAALKAAKAQRDLERSSQEAAKKAEHQELRSLAAKVKAETATAEEVRKALKLIFQRLQIE